MLGGLRRGAGGPHAAPGAHPASRGAPLGPGAAAGWACGGFIALLRETPAQPGLTLCLLCTPVAAESWGARGAWVGGVWALVGAAIWPRAVHGKYHGSGNVPMRWGRGFSCRRRVCEQEPCTGIPVLSPRLWGPQGLPRPLGMGCSCPGACPVSGLRPWGCGCWGKGCPQAPGWQPAPVPKAAAFPVPLHEPPAGC